MVSNAIALLFACLGFFVYGEDLCDYSATVPTKVDNYIYFSINSINHNKAVSSISLYSAEDCHAACCADDACDEFVYGDYEGSPCAFFSIGAVGRGSGAGTYGVGGERGLEWRQQKLIEAVAELEDNINSDLCDYSVSPTAMRESYSYLNIESVVAGTAISSFSTMTPEPCHAACCADPACDEFLFNVDTCFLFPSGSITSGVTAVFGYGGVNSGTKWHFTSIDNSIAEIETAIIPLADVNSDLCDYSVSPPAMIDSYSYLVIGSVVADTAISSFSTMTPEPCHAACCADEACDEFLFNFDTCFLFPVGSLTPDDLGNLGQGGFDSGTKWHFTSIDHSIAEIETAIIPVADMNSDLCDYSVYPPAMRDSYSYLVIGSVVAGAAISSFSTLTLEPCHAACCADAACDEFLFNFDTCFLFSVGSLTPDDLGNLGQGGFDSGIKWHLTSIDNSIADIETGMSSTINGVSVSVNDLSIAYLTVMLEESADVIFFQDGGKWILGGEDATCDQACSAIGMICFSGITPPTTLQEIKIIGNYYGLTVPNTAEFSSMPRGSEPYTAGGNTFLVNTLYTFECSTVKSRSARYCPCGVAGASDFQKAGAWGGFPSADTQTDAFGGFKPSEDTQADAFGGFKSSEDTQNDVFSGFKPSEDTQTDAFGGFKPSGDTNTGTSDGFGASKPDDVFRGLRWGVVGVSLGVAVTLLVVPAMKRRRRYVPIASEVII